MWKNIKDNLFEYSIGFIGFASLGIQFYIFKNEYNDKLEWISNFGDYFGFSAAFLSALVIVLLIRELKEQRESRVKLEKSFDDNAETLSSVKDYFILQNELEKVKEIKSDYKFLIDIIKYNKEQVENRTIHNNFSESTFINFFNHFFKTSNKYETITNLKIKDIQNLFSHDHYYPEPLFNSLFEFYSKIIHDFSDALEFSLIEFKFEDLYLNVDLKSDHNIRLNILINQLDTLNNIISINTKYIFLIFLALKEKNESISLHHFKLVIFYNIKLDENKLCFSKKNESGYVDQSAVFGIIKLIKSTKFIDLHETKK